MTYESFIGRRYLMAKRRSKVVSIITLISIMGVALGVTALIVVLSVMGGFKKDLTDKILGAKAHVVIQTADYDALPDPAALTDQVAAFEGVVGASPFLESEVMVSSPTNLSGVILRGIDPARVGQVSELAREMTEGKLEYLVDPAPLLKDLEGRRDRELDELLGKLDRERAELEARIEAGRNAEKSPEPEPNPQAPGPPEAMPAPEGAMPPIFEDEEPAAEEGTATDFAMPPIFEEAEPESPRKAGEESLAERRARDLPGLIIGPELAKSLQVGLGAEVNVVTPKGEMGPMGPIPRSRPFRVVGIFYSGMYEYDANFAYTTIADAAALLGQPGPTGIELKTVDLNRSIDIASALQQKLGPKFQVLDWQEMNQSLFFALKLEKIAMFVVLAFIILVASFGIVAMLTMIVIEKGREIAILKSMGCSDASVMRIFVYQGGVIGTLGAVLGLGMGLAICWFLKTVGFPLNSEVYYISTLPVEVDPLEIALVVISAVAISLLVTIPPSLQAARLRPVDGLRYE